MGQSTDGQICFGVLFEEDYEFPWGDDIEDWWRKKVGFKPSREIWDAEGEYIGGVRPDETIISAHFDEQRAFDEAHPLPIVEINTCSSDYPIYILAIPRSVLIANRGHAQAFDPTSLSVSDQEHDALLEFCSTHGLEYASGPSWFLSSNWN